MSSRSWLLTHLGRHLLSAAVRVATIATVLLTFSHATHAAAADEKGQAAASPCGFSDAEFDTTTDVRALDEYRDAIAQLLKQEKFAELDCLADAARAGKTRFPGGGWKLRNIYIGLEDPRPGHPTEEDWQQHLKLVERWMSSNPRSCICPTRVRKLRSRRRPALPTGSYWSWTLRPWPHPPNRTAVDSELARGPFQPGFRLSGPPVRHRPSTSCSGPGAVLRA